MAINYSWSYVDQFLIEELTSILNEKPRKTGEALVIVGKGWDPRMGCFVSHLKQNIGKYKKNNRICLIDYKPEKEYKSPQSKFIKKNMDILDGVSSNWSEIEKVEIITRNPDNAYVGDRKIIQFVKKLNINNTSDIFVDISSLPKSIYFPLIKTIAGLIITNKQNQNLFIITCQDSELDRSITESVDDVRSLASFGGTYQMEGKIHAEKIWVPLLEKGQSRSVEELYNYLKPGDIYPVLPFPSQHIRCDDDIKHEYMENFLDVWTLNPLNIIYAAENDPIDVYKSIKRLYEELTEILKPLGNIALATSPLSSKLSSLGVLMVSTEYEIMVAHAIGRHNPPTEMNEKYWRADQFSIFQKQIHGLWLLGDNSI